MEKTFLSAVRTYLLMATLIFVGTNSFAQITGKIMDTNTGEPLIGASVIVQGTTNGTITDIDGSYSLDANLGDVLVVSYVGYDDMTHTVASNVANISMAQGVLVDEVVVTGYQSQRKRDITGAISIISDEDLNVVPAASLSQKLAGKAAGVTISTSGSPGDGTAIRIRGFNSLLNNDPLVVIDGVPTRDNFLNSINPNDIESIQVLKDAASASVYGARSSNGVIVITTKKGTPGKTKVSYNGYYGTQSPVNRLDLITDSDRFRDYVVAATGTGDVPAIYAGSSFPEFYNGDPSLPYSFPDNLLMRPNTVGTDWWDESISAAPITEHNLNISGGNENATYSITGNYFDQEGTVNTTFFERFQIRANSSFKAGRFTFGENISASRINQIGISGGNQSEQNVITNIIRSQPLTPVFDEGGNFAGPRAQGMGLGNNPVKEINDDKDDVGNFNRLFGNFYAGVELIEGLTAKTSYGFDYGNGFTQDATFPNFEAREPNQFTFNFFENWNNSFEWTWTNTLNYVTNFDGKHDFNAVVGYEANRLVGRNIGGGLVDFFVFGVDSRFLNTGLADPNTRSVGSGGFQRAFNSVFGKIDYVYDDFIILSATVRNDGSSVFGANNRRGTFPAASIGVRLNRFINSDYIDDIKVRYSYGINGNDAIRPDNAFSLFGGSTGNSFYDITGSNNSIATGFALQARGNPDGKWEELQQHNFGIDATFDQGKWGIVLDVYRKETVDLLFTAALPGTSGSAAPAARNIASMQNTGFDAQLFYRTRVGNGVGVDLSLTLGHYQNEITQISDGQTSFFSNGSTRIGTTTINRVGDPIGSFFGLVQDGVFQSQAEVDAHAQQPGAAVGRLRFEDTNQDGVVDDNDRVVLGDFHPDLTAGFRVGLNYGNFDFNTFIFGNFGNELFNFNRLFTDFSQFEANVRSEVFAAWENGNTSNEFPAPDYAGRGFNSRPSSYYVEDGSYIRMESLQLGYRINNLANLPGSVRLYIQAQNLFTITGYTGLDPAFSNFGRNDTEAGLDFGNYPGNRTLLFGINLDL